MNEQVNTMMPLTMYKIIRRAFLVACSVSVACFLYAQTATPKPSGTKTVSWDFYNPIEIGLIDSLRKEIKGDATSPDELLYNSFSSQLDATSLDMHRTDSLLRYVMAAEACKSARNYLPPDNAMLFEAMGDKMLSKLADTLTAGIERKIFNPLDDDIAYLIRRLADDHYLINIKVSNATKTWRYIREGRFGYVFHKLTTTYKTEFMKFLVVAVLLIALLFFRKRIVRFIRGTASSDK